MKRRSFLRAIGTLGLGLAATHAFATNATLSVGRAVSRTGTKLSPLAVEARAVLADQVSYVPPARLPKVINVFLYGGPSELAGNLTNIVEIDFNSQNKYPATLKPGVSGSEYTRNGFWANAGGSIMESLLATGDMSLYRTVHRLVDDNKGHPRSILQNLVGNVDLTQPGMAHSLAAVLAAHNAFGARSIDNLIMPFVSFEGHARIFSEGNVPVAIPASLKPIVLDSRLAGNPFARAPNGVLPVNTSDDFTLDALARTVSAAWGSRYTDMSRSLMNRARLEKLMAVRLNLATVNSAIPTGVIYPNTRLGEALKVAVSVVLLNADTIFVAINGAGPGWDDHDDALSRYPSRMKDLMSALSAAAAHLKSAGRDDVVINAFGEFGRNVNINDTLGWDHGNNQNFYTVGGAGIPGRRLGKLVGKTLRAGTAFENRQYTVPTPDSYQFEPYAVAATMYRYFGVQNPEMLTGGVSAIDEISPPNLRI